MGLDCTAYYNCKYIGKGSYDEDEDVWRMLNGSALCRTLNYVEVYEHSLVDFPASSKGMLAGLYSYEDEKLWCAGSYTGYNHCRDALAKMAGYTPDTSFAENSMASRFPHTASVRKVQSGPFHSLLYFSDCDGVIGTEACGILANDFQTYDTKACQMRDVLNNEDGINNGDHWYDLYRMWRDSCEFASHNGFIVFH